MHRLRLALLAVRVFTDSERHPNISIDKLGRLQRKAVLGFLAEDGFDFLAVVEFFVFVGAGGT